MHTNGPCTCIPPYYPVPHMTQVWRSCCWTMEPTSTLTPMSSRRVHSRSPATRDTSRWSSIFSMLVGSILGELGMHKNQYIVHEVSCELGLLHFLVHLPWIQPTQLSCPRTPEAWVQPSEGSVCFTVHVHVYTCTYELDSALICIYIHVHVHDCMYLCIRC